MKKIECGKALQSKPAEAGLDDAEGRAAPGVYQSKPAETVLGNAKSRAAPIYVTIIPEKGSFSRNEA